MTDISSLELPDSLNILVDVFIKDLKEPKYSKPLTVHQLAYIFQEFYKEFSESARKYQLSLGDDSTHKQHARSSSLTNFSQGLSGIFSRSRSTSILGSNPENMSDKLSNTQHITEALASTPPTSSKIDPLSGDTLKSQFNIIEDYMKTLERLLFDRILSLGTSVPDSAVIEQFKFENLFKNNQEYIDYNSLFNLKVQELHDINESGDLRGYLNLDLPEVDHLLENSQLKIRYQEFTENKLSPVDKMESLIILQSLIAEALPNKGSDILLSMLIYLTIKYCSKQLFLTYKFIKLFRYSESLAGREMFVITNIEAVVVYISDLVDLPNMKFYNFKLGEQVHIDDNDETNLLRDGDPLEIVDKQFETNFASSSEVKDGTSITHQQQNLKNALNNNKSFSNFKSVLNKFYYSPSSQSPSRPSTPLSQLPIGFRDSETSLLGHLNSSGSLKEVHIEAAFIEQYKTFQGKKFDQFTVKELKQLFQNYEKMCDYL